MNNGGLRLLSLLSLASMAWAEPRPLDVLLDSEYAFNEAAQRDGVRAAFLEYLADGSIVFQPGPVDGRATWQSNPEFPGSLSWYPAVADISAAGDLGFTSGPYSVSSEDGERQSQGHYVSVWRLQDDGNMRVVVDAGVPHAAEQPTPEPLSPGSPASLPRLSDAPRAPQAIDEAAAIASMSMLEVDDAFSRTVTLSGYSTALRGRSDRHLRVYRMGQPPAEGEQAIETVGEAPRFSTWRRGGSGSARSGDLGYTYGTAKRATSPPAVGPMTDAYLRIWRRRGDDWILVVDLLVPLSPPESTDPQA